MGCNSCYNVVTMVGNNQAKQAIIEVLEAHEFELTPSTVHQKLWEKGVKRSRPTVRGYLRDLVRQPYGKVMQPYHGAYCSQIVYGMMVAPVRVHNVILSIDSPWLDFSDDVSEFVGDVRVRVQFGLERRRMTVRISCDAGMEYRALLFAVHRGYDIVEKRTGRVVEDVVVKTFEPNRDFYGVRIDGAKCYTRRAFDDFIDRVYQKGSYVRVESKISKDMTVDELLVLARGGVPQFMATESVLTLNNTVSKLVDAVKFQNEQLVRQGSMIEALVREIVKIKEKTEKV